MPIIALCTLTKETPLLEKAVRSVPWPIPFERLVEEIEALLIAERAGLSPTTIPKLESGRVEEPHPRTIRKLADALEVDPAELVGGSEPRPSLRDRAKGLI